MKRKNLVLAVVAFVFAAGSAFASMFTLEDVFVKAKADNDPETRYICTDANVQCDQGGSDVCQVQIVTSGPNGTITAATSGSSFKTYRSGCTQTIGTTGTAVLSSGITPYDVLSE